MARAQTGCLRVAPASCGESARTTPSGARSKVPAGVEKTQEGDGRDADVDAGEDEGRGAPKDRAGAAGC
jgi:hypothetical protein